MSKVLKHIDMPTILFFLGILMSVAALQSAGLLTDFADFLDKTYTKSIRSPESPVCCRP